MAEGVARCTAAWPGQGIRISAQAHLERFYGGLGFVRVGDPYLGGQHPASGNADAGGPRMMTRAGVPIQQESP
jgi:hypothetical protein